MTNLGTLRGSLIAAGLTLTLALHTGGLRRAEAWEPEVNAGLTERAARASRLHALLARAHGRALGLYEQLVVADAPALARRLALFDPTIGAVPDGRGRLPALGWLVAGALLEELPGDRSRHHFLDPIGKTGLTRRTLATVRGLSARVRTLLAGGSLPTSGSRADEWIVSPANEYGLARFWTELEAATLAGPSDARDRHLAYALVCAGAMTAVLEDLGSPSRSRNDLAAHVMPLGAGGVDLGSRTERLATLAFGRLGVPVPAPAPARATWRDFFTATDGQGLADVIHARAFSRGTLPPSIPAAAPLAARKAALAGVVPAVRAEDVARAPADDVGEAVHDKAGICIAHIRERDAVIDWLLPDACVVEQLAALLPITGGYAAGFLDWLFRGTLAVDAGGQVKAMVDLGAGTLTLLVDDSDGARRRLGGAREIAGGKIDAVLGQAPGLPRGTVRLIALFRGKDAAGDELVAVGQVELATPRDKRAPAGPQSRPAAR